MSLSNSLSRSAVCCKPWSSLIQTTQGPMRSLPRLDTTSGLELVISFCYCLANGISHGLAAHWFIPNPDHHHGFQPMTRADFAPFQLASCDHSRPRKSSCDCNHNKVDPSRLLARTSSHQSRSEDLFIPRGYYLDELVNPTTHGWIEPSPRRSLEGEVPGAEWLC